MRQPHGAKQPNAAGKQNANPRPGCGGGECCSEKEWGCVAGGRLSVVPDPAGVWSVLLLLLLLQVCPVRCGRSKRPSLLSWMWPATRQVCGQGGWRSALLTPLMAVTELQPPKGSVERAARLSYKCHRHGYGSQLVFAPDKRTTVIVCLAFVAESCPHLQRRCSSVCVLQGTPVAIEPQPIYQLPEPPNPLTAC